LFFLQRFYFKNSIAPVYLCGGAAASWIFFALAAASVFIFRRRAATGAYQTPGYPITPLFFVALSIWFVLNTLVESPAQAWAGLILLAVGGLVYYLWNKRSRATNVLVKDLP